jgi:uncharacterized protein GlcG (DUF336 family)
MVENLPNLPETGSHSTEKTSKLTAAQALEILQQALIQCQQAAVMISVAETEDGLTALILHNVRIDGDNLVPA